MNAYEPELGGHLYTETPTSSDSANTLLHNNTAVAQLFDKFRHNLALYVFLPRLLLLWLRDWRSCLLRAMLLAIMLVTSVIACTISAARRRGRQGWHLRDFVALEVYIYATLVLLSLVLQPQLLTQLLDPGLDLLDVIGRVVSLPDNDMKVCLTSRLCVPYSCLEHVFGFLHELAVQIDRVVGNLVLGVVRTEDVLRCLLVVLLHLGGVRLALSAKLLRPSAIASLVGFMSLAGVCQLV